MGWGQTRTKFNLKGRKTFHSFGEGFLQVGKEKIDSHKPSNNKLENLWLLLNYIYKEISWKENIIKNITTIQNGCVYIITVIWGSLIVLHFGGFKGSFFGQFVSVMI